MLGAVAHIFPVVEPLGRERELVTFHVQLLRQHSAFPAFEVADHAEPLALSRGCKVHLVFNGFERFHTEHLDGGSCLFLEAQASLNHLRVVEHHQSTLGQVVGQGSEGVFLHLAVVVDKQLAGIAFGKRIFGDTTVGQVVVVVGNMDVFWIFHCSFFS